MKKLFQLGAIFSALLFAQYTFAADCGNGACGAGGYGAVQGQQQECPADHAADDQAVASDCWVKYVHYEPQYYTTQRCVEEQIPCTRRCCRYVDQEYEVTKCRYVPQYYTEKACRKVPDYYDVQEYKTCKKYVPEQHCRYVPRYYWKHACGQPDCNTPCPQR
jgi:hypothetical protein